MGRKRSNGNDTHTHPVKTGTINDAGSMKDFGAILENIHESVVLVQNLRLVYCNEAFVCLTGYSRKELLDGVDDFLPSEQKQMLIERYKMRVAGQRVPSLYELNITRKDNSVVPVELSLNKIEFQGIPTVMIVVRDISKQKMAEQAQAESEQRYRMIIENLPVVTWITDINANTSYISSSVEKTYGYSPQEIIAKGKKLWLDRIHEDDREHVAQAFTELFQNGKTFDIEYRIQRKNGDWMWVHDLANCARGKDGTQWAYGVFVDITIQKNLEQQLRQSEKMQAIGELAGGIAHDFNNQLAGIIGYADLLKNDTADRPKLQEYADNIIKVSRRTADLVLQLLAFSRKGKYLSVPVDLEQVVHEVILILKHSISKKILIEEKLNAGKRIVIGDPAQLQNAILNCALNARDAMETGGCITFFTKVAELDEAFCKAYPNDISPGEYVVVGIEDTGIGMEPRILPHIFEPFFSTKEPGKGTGMGLASVYGTVRNHNGAVHVSSTAGRGTVVQLFFPSEPNIVNKPVEIDSETSVHGSAHVLLVEDEALLCDIGREMLRRLGYSVTICKNGREAVDFYQIHWEKTDIVIMDMIMPEMDGEEAFNALRSINPDVKVLFASGYSFKGVKKSAIGRETVGFIQKPFRQAELSRKIADILDKSSSISDGK